MKNFITLIAAIILFAPLSAQAQTARLCPQPPDFASLLELFKTDDFSDLPKIQQRISSINNSWQKRAEYLERLNNLESLNPYQKLGKLATEKQFEHKARTDQQRHSHLQTLIAKKQQEPSQDLSGLLSRALSFLGKAVGFLK